jgi:hypothetical protein
MGKKFERLEHKIEQEYRKKGYSKKRARSIGYATASKIYRAKKV